ncbi:DNA integrity scanning protein DisA nucleotide-binding domain protein [bacterium]|nr:DNA integrity scanning protein DisA nucleotide-binding domain protein [bacterium]
MRDASAVVEVVLLTLLFFAILRPLRSVKLVRAAGAILAFLLVAQFAASLGLVSLWWVVENLGQFIPILLVIIFQKEIRNQIEGISLASWFRGRALAGGGASASARKEIMAAMRELRRARLGALIVIEGRTDLESVLGELGGVAVEARVSTPLLMSIFHLRSPLHDGGVIIKNGRIAKAKVIIPLPAGGPGSVSYGTRHRAAMSATDGTDALALVVSEETQVISVSRAGQLQMGLDEARIEEMLGEAL